MRLLVALTLSLVLLAARADEARTETQPAFVVIVGPDSPVSALDKTFLAGAFLKKRTRWEDGARIRPVDLEPDDAARRAFTQAVMGRSVTAVRSYWQQQVFSGRDVPPPELEDDAAVVRFVLTHPGAIGYVSGGAEVGSARIVSVK